MAVSNSFNGVLPAKENVFPHKFEDKTVGVGLIRNKNTLTARKTSEKSQTMATVAAHLAFFPTLPRFDTS